MSAVPPGQQTEDDSEGYVTSVIDATALSLADILWGLVVVTARVAPTVLLGLLLAGSSSLGRQLDEHVAKRDPSAVP